MCPWIRFTCSLVYYGLALNTGYLHGDVYLNTFLAAAVELPAGLVSLLMINWKLFGRRWTGCISFIGAALVGFLAVPIILLGQNR